MLVRSTEFLKDSRIFANQILSHHAKAITSSDTHIHHHYDTPWWWWFPQSYHVPCYHHPQAEPAKEKNRNNNLLGAIATVASFATVYFAGQNYSELTQARRGIRELKEQFWDVRSEMRDHRRESSKLGDVCQRRYGILKEIEKNAANGLLWKAALATSSAAIALGIFATAPLFVTTGCVGGGISVAAMLWRAGVSSMDSSLDSQARKLNAAITAAGRDLAVYI